MLRILQTRRLPPSALVHYRRIVHQFATRDPRHETRDARHEPRACDALWSLVSCLLKLALRQLAATGMLGNRRTIEPQPKPRRVGDRQHAIGAKLPTANDQFVDV